MPRYHRDTDRLDLIYRGPDQTLNDVQVVYHQVEHDADVSRAKAKGAQAMTLDEERLEVVPGDGLEAGIEPLDVAYRQLCPAPCSGSHKLLSLLHAEGHRLFHENGDTLLEKRQGHGMVMQGRHGNADRIGPVKQKIEIGGPFRCELPGHRPGVGRIYVHHTDQLGTFHGGIDPRMLLPEVPYPNDAHL